MSERLTQFGWLLVWLSLVITAFLVRDILPVDETRYLSVAWEMWLRGNFVLPYLNGELYSQKPPMLFWLFHLGWSVFGVNEWWPRLVPSLFALCGLFIVRVLAKRMWPQQTNITVLVPWILGGSFFWAVFTTNVMFDMLLMAMVLLAILGIWIAATENSLKGWLLVGVAGGIGILVKGPVMMVHILFPVILAPWWSSEARDNKGRWYLGFLLASILATLIAFCWLLPAIYSGGAHYEQNILWHQSVGRAFSSFAHARPFWWYIPLVPFIFFPWLVWPPVWRALLNIKASQESRVRFLLSWILPTFILFSIFSGKQVHYLIPLFPAVALLLAFALDKWPQEVKRTDQLLPAFLILLTGFALLVLPELSLRWMPELPEPMFPVWGIAMMTVAGILFSRTWQTARNAVISLSLVCGGITVLLMAAIFPVSMPLQDVTPTAKRISTWQDENRPVGHLGKYHGQFQFVGRLKKPLTVVSKEDLDSWCDAHSDGLLLTYADKTPDPAGIQPEFIQQYRNRWITVWSCAEIKNGAEIDT